MAMVHLESGQVDPETTNKRIFGPDPHITYFCYTDEFLSFYTYGLINFQYDYLKREEDLWFTNSLVEDISTSQKCTSAIL